MSSRYPKFLKIDNKDYKINTDFRVAIECNGIAEDESIGDFERSLAIIYKLFGEEGINTPDHYQKLLEGAQNYLLCGKKIEKGNDEQPDMDYMEDIDYIEASFMSDYNIDLENTEMHWWKFNKLINGLSSSEMGNCCILNRVRDLRNYDTSKVDDIKKRQKIEEAKERVALKKYKKENNLTNEQEESMRKLNELIGL